MLAVQYTYFAAIKHGNAATATILQYLAPVFITGYAAIRAKRFPAVKEVVALVLAFVGTFFLLHMEASIVYLILDWHCSGELLLPSHWLFIHYTPTNFLLNGDQPL
jgi:hypothetical protein